MEDTDTLTPGKTGARLSRKPGESVVAPHLELAVTVLAIKGKVVRLGISSPERLAVYRQEVWQKSASRQLTRITNHKATTESKGRIKS